MKASKSLVWRMVLAVVLMIGFYLLAFGIAGGLLYIPYAEWKYAHKVHLKLLLFGVVTAGIILWSILPRIDKFIAPGPQLKPETSPKLFDMLKGIAGVTGQEMPSEVYLVFDLNAWVGERGGFMGMGSRRVMGVGLPLMQTLTVSQLRAVISHEFGHYYGGDTKLGPWVYKTRESIIRTVQNLAGEGSFTHLPFLWYGKAFLRITNAVSRYQEYLADALAAKLAGAKAAGDALKAVHAAGMAFGGYWANEVVPVLNEGYRPPLAQGFRMFLSDEKIVSAVEKEIGKELQEGKADPYDTHPALKERLAALAQMPAGEVDQDNAPAVSLIGDDVERLELEMLLAMAGGKLEQELKPVSWDEVGDKVLVPVWKKFTGQYKTFLPGYTPRDIASIALDASAALKKFSKPEHAGIPDEEMAREMFGVLGAALALVLHGRGWKFSAKPGEEIRFSDGGDAAISPFEVLRNVKEKKMTAEEWAAACEAAGIGAVDLGSVIESEKSKG